MNADELEKAVYDYTTQVLEICEKEDIRPQMIAVGNELSNGLLWPYGKVPEYKNIAKFVSAGIKACRKFDETIPVMVHLDNGGNNELYRRWFDNYFENGGEDFEYIGLSYYPFWHGSLKMLADNMADISKRYNKKLIIAEVSMGFTLDDYKTYEGLEDAKRKGMATKPELAALVPYPMTKKGQSDFMRAVMDVIKNVPNGFGCGFFYWEPAWIPVKGSGWATPASVEYMHEKGPYGNEWANQALFDYDGNALPALSVIAEYADK
jgi:arabinogalactan endo-1,4-beta-galactosidase